MKDFKNDTSETLSRFGRDRRERISHHSAEHVERRTRRSDDFTAGRYGSSRTNSDDNGYRPQKRSSYNPNFTDDNRLAGEQHGRYNRGGERDENRDNRGGRYGDNRGAAHTKSGSRYGGGRTTYGDERKGGYNSYGAGERKYSQNRHAGKPAQRRYYDENGDIDGNRIDADDPAYDFRQPQYRGGAGRSSDNRSDRPSQPRTAKPYGKPSGGQYRDNAPQRTERKGKTGQNRRDDRPRTYPKYSPERVTGEMRLNRFIAQSGICSRREADDFITAGLVTVNGEVVTTLGSKISPSDDVRFNGERIQGEHKVYLVLNKPKGYVTSLDDPHANKTVMELVKGACSERIYPVGRLDKNSVGLLLFTNDGDLTLKLTHPSLEKKKVYQVTLDKPLTNADMQSIADGIVLDDGEIHADEIACVKEDRKEIGIEIHSGRNRIVRRIFEHLGYTVQKLDRVYYAGLTKKNLKRGAWRFLTDAEVARLKSGRYE